MIQMTTVLTVIIITIINFACR